MQIIHRTFLKTCLLLGLLQACDPKTELQNTSIRNSCQGGSCGGAQGSSDLSVDLVLENTFTNSKDIPVSWAAIDNASEYQLDIAADENCSNIQQSLRLKANSTSLRELAEGTWYLCLKWTIEPKLHKANSKGVMLVVDRQVPEIKGETAQSLKLGESPIVSVFDSSMVKCVWSTGESHLTITDAETLQAKFSTPAAGNYIVQLECQDQALNSSVLSVNLTLSAEIVKVELPPETTAPPVVVPLTVNAGADKISKQAVTLTGTATGATSYVWSQVSGPGTLTFTDSSSLQTNVTASVDGAYVIQLKATAADSNNAVDELSLTWDATAPTVSAGQDVVIGTGTTLQGSVGADATTISWRKVSGPGTITFSSTTVAAPMVTASVDGTYILELSAADSLGNTATDQMQFQWLTTVPTVNVGPDLNVRALVSLAPTASNATTYAWTKVSGPGTITFSAATAKNTNVSASADGTYVLKLTASNAQAQTANDTLTLVWDTAPPTGVSAGADRSANLSFTQTGTATGASTYSWSKISGPGTVTFGAPTALATSIVTSADGTYTLRLTATDLAGNAATDDMVLTWDTTAPNNVSGLASTLVVKASSLAWTDGGGGTLAYLVLRGTATISTAPTRGTTYTAGTAIGAATVVAASNTLSFAESSLTSGTSYFYKIFAYDALANYSSGVEITVVPDYAKTLKATLTRASFFNTTLIMGIRNSGNYTYVCKEDMGMAIVNVTNPKAPVQSALTSLGNTSTAGWCGDVKVAGNMAYIADWDRGLVIVDVTSPTAPVVKGNLPLNLSYASVLAVDGNFVYVAVEDETTGGGLAIINVSNPVSPTLVSYTDTGGNAAGVAKIGNFVYVSHRNTGIFLGMKVLNVSNPAAPTLVQTIVRDNMEEVEVSGSYVYVAEGFEGVEVFDATNPAAIVSKSIKILPDLPDSGYAMSVSVSGNYAFVTSYDTEKMYVLDFSVKTAATVARTYAMYSAFSPMYVHVSGAYAYVSLDSKGMEVIEVFTLN